MEQWYVIVNPNAGTGLGKKMWSKIKEHLITKNFNFEFALTKHKEHAIDLTQKAISSGFKKFISVGGDGTVNEIINGVMNQQTIDTKEITLAMIPVGTGNDWRRSIALPLNYKETIDLVLKNDFVYHDIAKVYYQTDEGKQSRHFINMAGIGFDASVAIKSNEDKAKGKSSKLVYLKNLLSILIKYSNIHHEVTFDNGIIKDKVFSLSIGKGKYNGGGMKQCPNAIINDGFLDMTVIKDVTKLVVLKEVAKVFSGKHIRHHKIDTMKTKKAVINTKEKVFLEIDGETTGFSPFEFSVIPKKIKVVIDKENSEL